MTGEPVHRTPPKVPRPQPTPVVASRTVRDLEHRLAEAGGPGTTAGARLFSGFWDEHADSPLVEAVDGSPDERDVTFLWRDADAGLVLLFVNRLTDERDLDASRMRRVPGTDLWHLSYRMRADWRASYSFLPQRDARPGWLDGDDPVAVRARLDSGLRDPRNPVSCRNRAGTPMSVVALPDAPRQAWVDHRETVAGRGTVTERTAPGGRRAWVYAPPLPQDVAVPGTPVVLVLDGEVWTGTQDLATTVDNLVDDGLIRPPHLVMLDSGDRPNRWRELGSGTIGAYLATELLPWARRELPIGEEPGDVVVAGQSLGGLAALRTALEYPGVVGGVISQSASLWQDDLAGLVAATDARRLRIYQEVGRQEWVLREPNRELSVRLARAGARLRFVEYNGGHDYACWRGGMADGLRHLLSPA